MKDMAPNKKTIDGAPQFFETTQKCVFLGVYSVKGPWGIVAEAKVRGQQAWFA